jgi:hypothetical protein
MKEHSELIAPGLWLLDGLEHASKSKRGNIRLAVGSNEQSNERGYHAKQYNRLEHLAKFC